MYSLLSPNNFGENILEVEKSVVRARSDQPALTLPKSGPIKLPRQSRILTHEWTLEEFDTNPALLIMYLSDHCPYVQHLRKGIVELASCYKEKGLGVLAISSDSRTSFPQDGPDYPFTYWYDEEQDLAETLSVVCTPEFFLFKEDEDQKSFVLVYHGQFDDSRPDNHVPVTGRDLRIAIDCVLNDLPVPSDQKPCVGCSIKWHSETAEE